jgi:CBS domain-containing protein
LNVKQSIAAKNKAILFVRSSNSTEDALVLMKDNSVRALLVIDDDKLVGIVSRGDCAIKVFLEHHDPKLTRTSAMMTANPLTVAPANSLEECMAIMVNKHIRHLPVIEQAKVIGIISIGDVVKNVREQQCNQIQFLETYNKEHGNDLAA